MRRPAALPDGVKLQRSTPEFTATDLPTGLLAEHQLASSVWGVLHVRRGSLIFVAESDGTRRTILAGESHVIEPAVRHHIEPSGDVAFLIDFYR